SQQCHLSFSSSSEHMTVFHLAVALLEAFELGPALLWRPEEATLPQLFCHGAIQLALPVTGLESFIKPSLTEDIKKSFGFLVPPVHTCHGKRKYNNIKFTTTNLLFIIIIRERNRA
uniref:Uncharacterized protein n=1 Tax=Neovison vison TaxID=452646 RepID=A0A8C7AGF6_NEOVI